MDAFDALTVATVNVLSLSVMLTGGVLWVFDISSLDDMRRMIRGRNGDGQNTEEGANEEIEEWLASVLARKEQKKNTNKTTKEKEETR